MIGGQSDVCRLRPQVNGSRFCQRRVWRQRESLRKSLTQMINKTLHRARHLRGPGANRVEPIAKETFRLPIR